MIWTNNGTERRWKANDQMRYPVTLYFSYAISLRRPPEYPIPLLLHNHADGIAAMDLFVVPTISFRLLYGLLIMGHGDRSFGSE
jgi:hypothetical protein